MAYTDLSQLTSDLDIQMLNEGNSPHPSFDRAIMKIDGFIMPAVESRSITTSVGLSPTAGEMWLLIGAGSGLWLDQTDKFCLYYPAFDEGAPENVDYRDGWLFMPIKNGMSIWVKSEAWLYTRKNGTWNGHVIIANPSTTLSTQVIALNKILDALQVHGILV